MAKNDANYKIEKNTYRYKVTGFDENNKPIFTQVGDVKTSVCKGVNNFKELKSQLAKNPDKNTKVNYKDPTFTAKRDRFGRVSRVTKNPSQLKNVVKRISDTEFDVSYFNAVKK